MNSPIKNYTAEGAILKYHIVKFGSGDTDVVAADDATDLLIGITTELNVVTGEPVDVVHDGVHQVKLGGTVTRGNRLTVNANGEAVAAVPANDTNMSVIGTALASGVDGDVIPVLISLGQIQGEPA